MLPPCDLHVHTVYCDGKNTPRELAEAALAQGMTALGFSGHSFTPCDVSYCMLPESVAAYRSEILQLREEMRDRLEIYLGTERDYYTDQSQYKQPYDYVIGSVHYVFKGRQCLAIDHAKEIQQQAVEQLYGGDWMALVRDYYALMADMPARVQPDIIGHFDVIAKFNQDNCLFDADSPRYRHLALEAMDAILRTHRLFEINTGAIARKKRTDPYPALFLLRHLRQRGGEVVLTSDCHDARFLRCAFAEAAELARAAGFAQVMTLRGGQFAALAL